MTLLARKAPRILVVDDNADVCESLKIILEAEGYEVACAYDGDQALELQRKHGFDVVLTDIFMPGKEGIETIQAFRSEWPELKIVAMSGGGETAKRDYLGVARSLGAQATLKKPFLPEELVAVLKRL